MENIMEESAENYRTGYIKLYRSMKKHWLWDDSHVKSKLEAWIDLLMRVKYNDDKKPVGYDMIQIKRGQILTSQEQLAKDWRWDRSTVRKFLNLLQKDSMILVKTTHKYTMITICKYECYNGVATGTQHQDNINATSTQHIEEGIKNNKNVERSAFLEFFQRATFKIPDEELLKEIGMFQNKYPNVDDPRKAIPLINAWCSNMIFVPEEDAYIAKLKKAL